MVRQQLRTVITLFCLCATVALLGSTVASAVTAGDWKAGRIVDDAIFTDKNAMSVDQIQAFLNNKVGTTGYGTPGECDTYGVRTSELGGGTRAEYGAAHGNPIPFTCLKDYYEVPKVNPGPDAPASNYGGAPIPPGAKSAAQLIWDSSQKHNINPRALLVKLATESPGPLTSDDWPFKRQYLYAMGAHCPDSGPGGSAECDINYSGFSLQMDEAASLLRWYLDSMTQSWWQYKKPYQVNHILWNVVERGCGGSNVYIETKATAALYTYTPYQPNQAALNNMYSTGDNCSAYGNRNFWRVWSDWFGSTRTLLPYDWSLSLSKAYVDSNRLIEYTPSPTLAIKPGSKAYIRLHARNNGNQTWSQSNVRLGTTSPRDRMSIFADTSWNNGARISLQEASVVPGDTGSFLFSLTAPIATGSYKECFGLVAEGIAWMPGPSPCYNIDVVNSQENNDQNLLLTASQSMKVGEYLMSPSAHSILAMQADGNLVLYSDSQPRWSASTGGTSASTLVMQSDGNLVLYDQLGRAHWSTGTVGNPNARVVLQSDGNLVVYSASNAPLWSSGTHNTPSYSDTVLHSLKAGTLFPHQSLQTADRNRTLQMQRDGNLVLYASNKVLWASYTQGNPGASVTMQADGNFVIYSKTGRPLWASYTQGNPGSTIVLQDDGNLVIYNSSVRPVWHTKTYAQ